MSVLAQAARLQEAGKPFVLATVVWRRGPSSGQQGSKAIVHPDGTVEGWLGGACAEPTLARRALQALGDGAAHLLVLGEHDHREGVEQVAMACESEGAMEVFLEPMLPAPQLVVVGRSPMVDTLLAMASQLGWRAKAVDEPVLDGVDRDGLVVVATQGHFDEPALEAALRTPAAYVGLVASAKRASNVVEWLRSRGIPEEQLARVRAPAGLELGRTTHEEMAVAILAELVAVRASARAGAEAPELPSEATDPVCGMTVDPATARFSSERVGITYWFCAAGCQRRFEESNSVPPEGGLRSSG